MGLLGTQHGCQESHLEGTFKRTQVRVEPVNSFCGRRMLDLAERQGPNMVLLVYLPHLDPAEHQPPSDTPSNRTLP